MVGLALFERREHRRQPESKQGQEAPRAIDFPVDIAYNPLFRMLEEYGGMEMRPLLFYHMCGDDTEAAIDCLRRMEIRDVRLCLDSVPGRKEKGVLTREDLRALTHSLHTSRRGSGRDHV